jgi:hypothetical protein
MQDNEIPNLSVDCAHTANKARCYINVFREKDPVMAETLVQLAEAAMNTGNWKTLALVMGRWW